MCAVLDKASGITQQNNTDEKMKWIYKITREHNTNIRVIEWIKHYNWFDLWHVIILDKKKILNNECMTTVCFDLCTNVCVYECAILSEIKFFDEMNK